ncbi:hypothetical protein PG984_008965, partial [Apiospora sp. TS-2023a]
TRSLILSTVYSPTEIQSCRKPVIPSSQCYSMFYLIHLILLVLLSWTAAAGNAESLACRVLTTEFPKQVSFPGDATYNLSLSSYSYAQEQMMFPACIFQPVTTPDVACAVRALRNSSAAFAIRSGGHATNPGFSNIGGGVTIDLTTINDVHIHEDGVTVSVGTGATWGDVYRVLDASGRSLNGGRASGVGIGGYLLGGGIGFFALKHGFGCDAVVGAEVVLSSGKVIETRIDSHPQLFRALKGGSNNFGIVTRWDIATIAQGHMWGGGVTYPSNTTAQQLEAFTQWKSSENFDAYSSVEQSHVWIGSSQTQVISNSIIYTKPIKFPSNLKNYTNIKPQLSSTLRVSNVSDFAEEIQSYSTPNQNTIYVTTTVRITPTILTKVHSLWRASVEVLSAKSTITSSLTLQSIPAPPSDPTRANSLGFDPASTPQKDLVLVLLTIFWEDTMIGEHATKSAVEFVQDVDRLAQQESATDRFRYPNYAGAGQAPLLHNGQLDFLRKVAAQYDPDCMFHRQVPGGWKLYP